MLVIFIYLYSQHNFQPVNSFNLIQAFLLYFFSLIFHSSVFFLFLFFLSNSEYIKLLECFEKSFHSVDKCKSQSEEFLNFVRSIFDDIVNLTCAEYTESSDKCEKLTSPPSKDKSIKRTKSFMVPLMKVWESADTTDGTNNNKKRI